MNLEDLIDENGLQQDEWSLSRPTFGETGQLEVVGWSGKNKKGKGAKYYIVMCSKCSSDSELFNGGYFKTKSLTPRSPVANLYTKGKAQGFSCIWNEVIYVRFNRSVISHTAMERRKLILGRNDW